MGQDRTIPHARAGHFRSGIWAPHEVPTFGHITLWSFNIAMGNGPFIDGLPIINGDFPWLC